MRMQLKMIIVFLLGLILTMQNCSSNKLKSSDQSSTSNNNDNQLPSDSNQVPPLTSDLCTELVEGRNLKQTQGLSLLDNLVTMPLDKIIMSDITYQTPAGWDAQLSKLDLFSTESWKNGTKKRPVFIFFHGGGVDGTDKSDLYTLAPLLPDFFLKKGFVFINANYRLFQSAKSPNTNSHNQVADAAKVVKWVVNNIDQYGGDPAQIVLMGISSSAHIVSLLNTNHIYFNNEEIPLKNLKAVIALDSPHYHIPLSFQLFKGTSFESNLTSLVNLYGGTRDDQLLMSPVNYIVNNSSVKPTLLISAGWKDGIRQAMNYPATLNYKNELIKNGHSVEFYHFDERDYATLLSVNSQDQVNVLMGSYLDKIFSQPSSAPELNEVDRMRIFDSINSTYQLSPNTPGIIYGYISNTSSMVVSCGSKSLFSPFQRANFNTLFSIGSLTKIFTGLVLAKLVKENKVLLSDTASSLISNSSISSLLSSDVTLGRLVTHTSGLSKMPANLTESRDINGDGVADVVDANNPASNYGEANLINCLNISISDPWGRCQPRLTSINTYWYSNLGFGLLSYALQDQKSNKFPTYTQFFREYFGIPLSMEDSFAEASDINLLLINNFLYKDISNEDITAALSTLKSRFAGLHNYANDSATTPIEISQPDMGILAGAGEIKASAQSLSKYLNLLLGNSESTTYNKTIIDEFHRQLFADTVERISYGVEIETNSVDGTDIYMKTGVTNGSTSYLKWSRAHQNGMFVLMNRNPNTVFWENSGKLYKSLSGIP